MDDVARRAGVGVGTVYRHFPTKEALIEALAVDAFERDRSPRARGGARASRIRGRRSPTALWAGAEILAADRAFTEIVGEIPGRCRSRPELQRELHEIDRRADAARAGGRRAARRTSSLDDIPMFMCGIGAATRKTARVPGRLAPPPRRSSSTACAPRAPRRARCLLLACGA